MTENRRRKGQTPSIQHGRTLLPRQGVDVGDLEVFVCAVKGARLVGHFVEWGSKLHTRMSDEAGMLKYSGGVYISEAISSRNVGLLKMAW
jgi:hypothetical protein